MPKTTKHLKPYQFKKGAPSANPLGGKLHNPIAKDFKKLTLESYREVIEIALSGNIEALKELISNPKTSVVQVGVGTALLKAIKDGDPSVLERFCERIVGKIPDVLQVTSHATGEQSVTHFNGELIKDAIKKIREDV